MRTIESPFGRLVPAEFDHVAKYHLCPEAAINHMQEKKIEVEVDLILRPVGAYIHYDQKSTNKCVSEAVSRVMSIYNNKLYDTDWLYKKAQEIDEISGPHQGTTVKAAFDVLRKIGHKRYGKFSPSLANGIKSNYWATTIDGIRIAVGTRNPCVLGINWYGAFDFPTPDVNTPTEGWIGQQDWGHLRGGHAVVITGISDKRQAVSITNSYGKRYPERVWLPYTTLEKLLAEDGECGVVVDR